MNTNHESYLAPFFKEMNIVFNTKWCVLHSYENLPYYSESDVDMAFSGTDIRTLELLIKKVADSTGWVLLQKLWYDVQNCYYYVLRNIETDTLLAIDFLIDNDAIGKYGFTTKTLTTDCTVINDCFPIPNSEVAFCYKLIKSIVKRRSVEKDEQYLRETYKKADKDAVNTILDNQLGSKGKELILRYLTDKNASLTKTDITLLYQMRKETLNSLKKGTKYRFWELKRGLNRFFYPSGMVLSVPNLDEEELKELTIKLIEKVDIIFRFVKISSQSSTKMRLKGFAGSTLVVCPSNKSNLKSTWSKNVPISIVLYKDAQGKDIDSLANTYYETIISTLADRMTKRMPNGH